MVEESDGGTTDDTRNASATVVRRNNLGQVAVGNWTREIGSWSSEGKHLRTLLLRCSLQGPFVISTLADAFRTHHHSDSARLGWKTAVYTIP